VYIQVNAKLVPVKTVPRIGGGDKGSSAGDEFKYDIFDVL
jgi:hypothetical protein